MMKMKDWELFLNGLVKNRNDDAALTALINPVVREMEANYYGGYTNMLGYLKDCIDAEKNMKLTKWEWTELFEKLNKISDDAERNELIDNVLGKDVGQRYRDGVDDLTPMTLLEANVSEYRLSRADADLM